MERKLIKKIVIAIMLLSIVFIYSLTKVSLADTTPIDLNSLNDISTGVENNGTNTSVNSSVENSTENSINNAVVNNVSTNTSKLPQTGSNNEIIFVVGLTVLVGTTIFIYGKMKKI